MDNRCVDDAALLDHERSSVDTHVDKFPPYEEDEPEPSCCCCFGGWKSEKTGSNWISTFRRWINKVTSISYS